MKTDTQLQRDVIDELQFEASIDAPGRSAICSPTRAGLKT